MTTPYIDPNLIFAENAPTQDKPAAFSSYDRGWDASRNNDGRPTIKQSNFLQQQNDLKIRYIHENGAALPYKDGITYEENSVVLKDGVLQQWKSGSWVVVGDDKLSKLLNLSDVQDAEAARTNLGLGTAATSDITTSKLDSTLNRLMKVGDYGFGTSGEALGAGGYSSLDIPPSSYSNVTNLAIINHGNVGALGYPKGFVIPKSSTHFDRLLFGSINNNVYHIKTTGTASNQTHSTYVLRTAANTTVDSNGFIKNASPIVQIFADKIELNDEAQQQSIEFERLGVGDYLIKGSSGFAQDGWYIETPKDANGNLLVAVVYEQLENGNISVKTYDYMLNNKGRIVADTETPLDIPESRWIDLRLQEIPTNID